MPQWLLGAFAFMFFLLLVPATSHAQTAHTSSGLGAVNGGMAGAGTAMPLSPSGALYWNPGSITELETSELELDTTVVLLDIDLSSSLDANAIAPGVPARNLAGTTGSNIRHAILPSASWVYKPQNDRWAYGVLAAGIGGFGVQYDSQGDNPMTSPQPPRGFGTGDLEAGYQLMQIAPTVAYKVTDHLSVGVAPTFDISALKSRPFAGTAPDDANGDGFSTYPDGNTAWSVGGGVQGGVYYQCKGWHLGASIKSPQWIVPFRFKSQDELGDPRSFKFRLDYPMIISAGVGYSGHPKLKLATDVRYLDYEHTNGFEQSGFDPKTGVLRGLGWKSIWAVATGVQAKVTQKLSVRAGYGFNQNPIRQSETALNIVAPVIAQHHLFAGFSYRLTQSCLMALAYHHGFMNTIQGPFQTPAGAIPNSSVKVRSSSDSIFFSLIFK